LPSWFLKRGFWEIHGYSHWWHLRIFRWFLMDSVTVRQANPWRAQVLSDAPKEEGEVGNKMIVLWI
jgi:hypothetical protein